MKMIILKVLLASLMMPNFLLAQETNIKSARADASPKSVPTGSETNTVEIIKELTKKVDELTKKTECLEQKVSAIETNDSKTNTASKLVVLDDSYDYGARAMMELNYQVYLHQQRERERGNQKKFWQFWK